MSEPFVLDVGMAVQAIRGEHVCGDVVLTRELDEHRLVVFVADGLGHGPAAAEAATSCAEALSRTIQSGFADAFNEAHRALRQKRGAVAAAVVIDRKTGVAEVGVLGNIAVRIIRLRETRNESTVAVATPGVFGSAFRRVNVTRFDLEAGDVVVVHSDGVRSRFEPIRVRAADARSAAEEIVANEGRSHDDASCVVVRVLPASARLPSSRPALPQGPGIDVSIRRPGDVQVAATSAREFASGQGFDGRRSWEVGIAVAELAQNILKYGVEGVVSLRLDDAWLVVEAVDRGPGLGAAGSRPGLGQGLLAVERMMDSSEISSGPLGVRVVARKRLRPECSAHR